MATLSDPVRTVGITPIYLVDTVDTPSENAKAENLRRGKNITAGLGILFATVTVITAIALVIFATGALVVPAAIFTASLVLGIIISLATLITFIANQAISRKLINIYRKEAIDPSLEMALEEKEEVRRLKVEVQEQENKLDELKALKSHLQQSLQKTVESKKAAVQSAETLKLELAQLRKTTADPLANQKRFEEKLTLKDRELETQKKEHAQALAKIKELEEDVIKLRPEVAGLKKIVKDQTHDLLETKKQHPVTVLGDPSGKEEMHHLHEEIHRLTANNKQLSEKLVARTKGNQ